MPTHLVAHELRPASQLLHLGWTQRRQQPPVRVADRLKVKKVNRIGGLLKGPDGVNEGLQCHLRLRETFGHGSPSYLRACRTRAVGDGVSNWPLPGRSATRRGVPAILDIVRSRALRG